MAYPDVRVYIDFTSDALAEATDWVDVTDDVVDLETEWGRSSLVDEFQPGGGSLTLRSFNGQYDPTNEDGPYYGLLLPRRRIKVEVPVADEAEYSDDFEDGTVGSEWTTIGTVAESDGELVITAPASPGVSSIALDPVDFTDRHVTVDCTVAVSGANVDCFPLRVDLPGGGYAGYIVRESDSVVILRPAVNTTGALNKVPWTRTGVPYSATDHRYLRIRHHRTMTYWQVSADGTSWTTLMALDIAWAGLDQAVIYGDAFRTGAGGSLTVTWRDLWVHHELVHPISYGWIKGWPTRQTFRTQAHVGLEWQDALGVLGTVELPNSVWDYRVRSLGPAAWYRLADEGDTAQDLSGHGHHASWRAYEGTTPPSGGTLVPPSVAKAGRVESLIPLANNGAVNFAKMLAELGQPLVLSDPPRSVSVVCPDSLSGLLADRYASVELWCMARPAFPLAVTGAPSSTSSIRQALVTWGEPGGQWVEIGISAAGMLYVGAASTTSVWGDATVFYGATSLPYPFHLVVVFYAGAGTNTNAAVYVNGTLFSTINLGTIPIPLGPPVIGRALASTVSGGARQLQSTVGDVVFYDRLLTGDEVRANYRAGRFGAILPGYIGVMPPDATIVQTLEIAGYQVPHHVQPDVNVYSYESYWCEPGRLNKETAISYCRKLASSGQEPFYQAPDGALTLLTRGWQHQLGRAAISQARLGDDASSTVGYAELDYTYDADTVTNDCTVKWSGGEQRAVNEASVAAYGPLRDNVDTCLWRPDDALQVAWWRVNTRGEVRRLVDGDLHLQLTSDEDFDTALRMDFASRVTLVRTTPDGRQLEDDYWVQGIRHRVEPGQGQWDTWLTLEPADVPGRIFRFGISEWGGPDVLTL